VVKRNYATERDGHNQKKVDNWQICHPSMPCYAWSGPMGGRHAAVSGVMVIVVDLPGAVVPFDMDVLSGDRITEVKDRAGTTVLEAMEVDAVFPRATHKELRLKQYAGLEG